MAKASWRTLFWHLSFADASRTRCTAASVNPVKIATTAITTTNSIRVKAARLRCRRMEPSRDNTDADDLVAEGSELPAGVHVKFTFECEGTGAAHVQRAGNIGGLTGSNGHAASVRSIETAYRVTGAGRAENVRWFGRTIGETENDAVVAERPVAEILIGVLDRNPIMLPRKQSAL